MKKKKLSFTNVGASSILTIFAVLCFIVFALLSLSTATANHKLAIKSVDAVTSYYEADTEAEHILAQIRQGEVPDGVSRDGNTYTYACPIDENQQLSVEVAFETEGGDYQIRKWKKEYIGEWETDDTIEVWDGMEELLEE